MEAQFHRNQLRPGEERIDGEMDIEWKDNADRRIMRAIEAMDTGA